MADPTQPSVFPGNMQQSVYNPGMPTTPVYDALAKVQEDVPDLVKDGTNPHFGSKFISLPTLLDQVLPVFRKHDLMLLQPPTNIGGTPALTTLIVSTKTGATLSFTTPLIMAKADAQGHGGAITYMRRYALMSLLGLVADEDDDGNSASFNPKDAEKAKKSAPSFDGGSPF